MKTWRRSGYGYGPAAGFPWLNTEVAQRQPQCRLVSQDFLSQLTSGPGLQTSVEEWSFSVIGSPWGEGTVVLTVSASDTAAIVVSFSSQGDVLGDVAASRVDFLLRSAEVSGTVVLTLEGPGAPYQPLEVYFG